MSCGSLDGRGVWRRMDNVYVWLTLFAVHLETITTLLIDYGSAQNNKLKIMRHQYFNYVTKENS